MAVSSAVQPFSRMTPRIADTFAGVHLGAKSHHRSRSSSGLIRKLFAACSTLQPLAHINRMIPSICCGVYAGGLFSAPPGPCTEGSPCGESRPEVEPAGPVPSLRDWFRAALSLPTSSTTLRTLQFASCMIWVTRSASELWSPWDSYLVDGPSLFDWARVALRFSAFPSWLRRFPRTTNAPRPTHARQNR